jgi:hypothetical protein
MLRTEKHRSNAASHVHADGTSIETAAFFGDDPERMFGVLYSPRSADAVGAVVICPAICSESLSTYRHDVLLARALAGRGIATLRFHYRGTGHSDGDGDGLTFDGLRDDVLAARAHLSEALGTEGPILLGTRFSALVAAAAASAEGAPLVLWEPVLDGRRYFREGWRASMVLDIREGAAERARHESLTAMLARDGYVDVVGYPLGRALYESSVDRTLLGEIGDRGRPMLIVRGGAGTATEAQFDQAVEELRRRGFDVAVEMLAEQAVWWFLGPKRKRESQAVVADLIARTVAWLERLATGDAVP